MSYYKSNDTNPRWFKIFTEQIESGENPENIIDQLAELACGIKTGASDECQRYAKHIRAHLEAAFKVGEAFNRIIPTHPTINKHWPKPKVQPPVIMKENLNRSRPTITAEQLEELELIKPLRSFIRSKNLSMEWDNFLEQWQRS